MSSQTNSDNIGGERDLTTHDAFLVGKLLGTKRGHMAFLSYNPYSYTTMKEHHEEWARGVAVGMGIENDEELT